jgi:hypothetical protein
VVLLGGQGDPGHELTLNYTTLGAKVGRCLVSSQGDRWCHVAPVMEAGGDMAAVARLGGGRMKKLMEGKKRGRKKGNRTIGFDFSVNSSVAT